MRRILVLCLMLPLFCMSAAAETVIISVDSTNLRVLAFNLVMIGIFVGIWYFWPDQN